ncbi:hypothetical protein N7509_009669 [Penicillium cosmopolitanum]|uniref:Uncharacterized protein n=1 Tax=Penicillium cosmopolitanum TaxID=1131564 RepID=A0A9W9VPV8_9EURO|nr:uncharacterized protein N7509_009669 [Penicillium cosmopolitanum]KAJ5387128.1 hypothetical protein N7509_009669 [Penicillium cosmopolitanum]
MYYAIQGLALIFVLALYLVLRKSKSSKSQSGYFKDKIGDPIPSLPEDTRFRRFTNGKEISDQGAKEFGERPFLVRNGRHRELIISHPSHIKDFYMQDAAGE